MTDWIGTRADTKPHHAVALLILAGVILGRWWTYLTSPVALGDEGIYLQAFRAATEAGETARTTGFYYPRTFAILGGWLLETVGESATRFVLRTGAVFGLATTVWISICLWVSPWTWRVGIASLFVSLSPAVYFGIETGNISFAVIGAILLALTVWSVAPATSGVLLGGSTAIKPLAPLALLALLAHRPAPPSRRSLIAGFVGAALMAVIFLLSPGYLSTSAATIDRLPFIRSFSLNRILLVMGLETSPVAVAAILGVLILVVARSFRMPRQNLLCFGGLAAVLAVPIIWSHTLLLTLPLQVRSLVRVASRKRDLAARSPGATSEAARIWQRYEAVLVVLAVLILQSTRGLGAVDDQAPGFELAVLVIAYLAAPFLMAFVLATDTPDPDASSQSRC